MYVCPKELSETGTIEGRLFVYKAGERDNSLADLLNVFFSFPLASLLCSKGSFCCVFMFFNNFFPKGILDQ